MILAHPCCWYRCGYYATGQLTMPAPVAMGATTSLLFLCAYHQRAWQVALAATALGPDIAWASFSVGRAPIVGASVP